SDNGSQFVAIRKRLINFLEELQVLHPEIELRFSWQLQTAISPWRGGFYERLIRSVKTALTAIPFRALVMNGRVQARSRLASTSTNEGLATRRDREGESRRTASGARE